MTTARRLRALEAETARRAQVAGRHNRRVLLTARSLMPPHLLAALAECERVWGGDDAGLARCIASLTPPGAGLDLDPATCPAAVWIVAAGEAVDLDLPLPQPPPSAAATLKAQAARWAQLAQAHAGQPLGKVALYRQAHLTMCEVLCEAWHAAMPHGAK